MTTLLRRNTFNEFDQMMESMEKAFGSLWNDQSAAGGLNTIPLDVYEKDNALFMRASVPGIKPEDIEVLIDKDVLTIKGEHKAEWKTEDAKVYHSETRYGSFFRSMRFPEGYMLDKAEADFDQGVLTVRVPRTQVVKPETRRLAVKPAPNGHKAMEAEPKAGKA